MKKRIVMKYPSSLISERWRDGIPLGNGEVGALIYGGACRERVMLTSGELWRHKNTLKNIPDVSENLEKVRQLLSEKKYFEADCTYAEALENAGYEPNCALPMPVCDIIIENDKGESFKKFTRILDMESAEAVISFEHGDGTVQRWWFVSRENGLVMCRIKAREGISFNITAELHDTETFESGDLPEYEVICENGALKYAAENDDGTDFGAVIKLCKTDGAAEYRGSFIHIENAEETVFAAGVFTSGRRIEDTERILKYINKCDTDYERCLEKSAKMHRELFQRCTFNLYDGEEHSNEELLLDAYYSGEASAELFEKLWAFGRYMFISGTGKYPFHLYGLWCGSYNPLWAINMFNENVQMIHWHVMPGNMPELMLPLFDYIEGMMDDYRENARKIFGLPGIQISCYNTPDSGLHTMTWPHIIEWIGGAGWMAQHYFDYYLYTRDEKFLRERAMPFMKEAMEFYEAFLVPNGDEYIIYPSVSPENKPLNYPSDRHRSKCMMLTAVNSLMDIAIIKELARNLIISSEITGMYREDCGRWKSITEKLPKYMIGDGGAVKEWSSEELLDNNYHRHLSHLYPIFPGSEVTRKNNPLLFEAFYKSLKNRLVIGLKEQTGWSLAHMANIYSRFSDGDGCMECLNILCRSCLMNNLFTVHNDNRGMGPCIGNESIPPVQLDALMGIVSALQDMLVYSSGSELHIAEGLTDKLLHGSAGPFCVKGGGTISAQWDFEKNKFEFQAVGIKGLKKIIIPPRFKFENGENEMDILFEDNRKYTIRFFK